MTIVAVIGALIAMALNLFEHRKSAMLVLLITIIMACCTHQQTPNTAPVRQDDQISLLNAWTEAGLQISQRCVSKLSKARLLVADTDDVVHLCQTKFAPCKGLAQLPCADSCALISQNVIVVHDDFVDLPGHRIHEMLHLLHYCENGAVDYDHNEQTVWCTVLTNAGGGSGFCRP